MTKHLAQVCRRKAAEEEGTAVPKELLSIADQSEVKANRRQTFRASGNPEVGLTVGSWLCARNSSKTSRHRV